MGCPFPYHYFSGPEDAGKIRRWIEWFKGKPQLLGLDTETLGLDPMKHRVRLVQIGTADYACVFDLDGWRLAEYGRADLLDAPWHRNGLRELQELLLSPSIMKILHNAQFDINMLASSNTRVDGPIFDTYLASKIVNNGLDVSNGLQAVVKRNLGVVLSKEQQKSDWGAPELSIDQIEYAAADVPYLVPLMPLLTEKLATSRVSKTVTLLDVFKLEMQVLQPVASMQMNGFGFNSAAALVLRQELEAEEKALELTFLTELDQALKSRHPHDETKWLPRCEDGSFNTRKRASGRGAKKIPAGFNAGSGPQMAKAFTDAGIILPPSTSKKAKPGTVSLSKVLLAFMRADYSLINAYMEWKEASTAISCLTTLQTNVHTDGRIHGSYNQMEAVTGRTSAREPNLQQVPRGKRFRRLFVAKPGYVLVGGDFSQIELRVVTELSGEPAMIDAYQNERDLHVETAARIVEKAFDMVSEAERQSGKVANFGLIYGAGPPTLRKQAVAQYRIAMTLPEAQAIVDGFRRAYPELYKWQQIQGTSKKPAVYTLYGRRRMLVGFNDSYTRRLNTPVQGTAGDIAKIAIAMLWPDIEAAELGEVRLIAMVHDELILEVRKDRAEYWKAQLKKRMEAGGALLLKTVPVVADVKIGHSWAETK